MREKEKIYRTMKGVGTSNLILGIIMATTGIAAGVLTIINGARLLKRKNSVLL
ncbi:MAG: hypothetical protein Q4E91_05155 [Lachnospiraceae bacterium]|nr:hypothetical protein [Lachnospiraceae bacterium]